MSRYRNRYRSSELFLRQRRLRRLFNVALVVVLLGLGVGAYFVVSSNVDICGFISSLFCFDGDEEEQEECVQEKHCRLCRSEIPPISFNGAGYRNVFNDVNDLQLEAAKKMGLTEADMNKHPQQCGMIHLHSTSLYHVDTLHCSKPYLVEPAMLLMQYIGERFATVAAERNKDGHSYKPIITSVLRTNNDVICLRQINSNATENSCHVYGTTVDITYIRYMRDDGVEVFDDDLWLKDALAQTLYELRYEGLCYVIYEVRQPCFHITVRSTEYRGEGKKEYKVYDVEKVKGKEWKQAPVAENNVNIGQAVVADNNVNVGQVVVADNKEVVSARNKKYLYFYPSCVVPIPMCNAYCEVPANGVAVASPKRQAQQQKTRQEPQQQQEPQSKQECKQSNNNAESYITL